MPQIEEDIKEDINKDINKNIDEDINKNIDEKRINGEIKTDDARRRKIAKKYSRIRYKLQTVIGVL